jgi:hypothetical protein
MTAQVCMTRYGAEDDAMICGSPAPYREGQCIHEHRRAGPVCGQHAAYSLCRDCYSHPENPHKCVIRFAEGSPS